MQPTDVNQRWSTFLTEAEARTTLPAPLEARGRLTRLAGLVLEASGIHKPVGSQCNIDTGDGGSVLAEVVGFSGNRSYLMPAGDVHGRAFQIGPVAGQLEDDLAQIGAQLWLRRRQAGAPRCSGSTGHPWP